MHYKPQNNHRYEFEEELDHKHLLSHIPGRLELRVLQRQFNHYGMLVAPWVIHKNRSHSSLYRLGGLDINQLFVINALTLTLFSALRD